MQDTFLEKLTRCAEVCGHFSVIFFFFGGGGGGGLSNIHPESENLKTCIKYHSVACPNFPELKLFYFCLLAQFALRSVRLYFQLHWMDDEPALLKLLGLTSCIIPFCIQTRMTSQYC